MKKILGTVLGAVVLVLGLQVAAPAVVGARHGSIDRCRGIVQTHVVHQAGHKPRTLHVCVPATKRLDATIGLGADPSGFTVAFSYSTTVPGPVAQVYDRADGNVLSIYASKGWTYLLRDRATFSSGVGPGADGKTHRVAISATPDGHVAVEVDGHTRSVALDGWSGPLPTDLRIALGGFAIRQDDGVHGPIGTVFHGSVSRLIVSPSTP